MSAWAPVEPNLGTADLLVFDFANESCSERKNGWSTSRTKPSTKPTCASLTPHALPVTLLHRVGNSAHHPPVACFPWGHSLCPGLPGGKAARGSGEGMPWTDMHFPIREGEKRNINKVILPPILACTVHLHEHLLSPNLISLAVHALLFPAQI